MASFDTHDQQLPSTPPIGCPFSQQLNNMPEEQKTQMLSMYQDMVKSGQHIGSHEESKETRKCTRDQKLLDYPDDKHQQDIGSTGVSSAEENRNDHKVAKKEKKLQGGCPFFSKELTDPQGKNLTPGYP